MITLNAASAKKNDFWKYSLLGNILRNIRTFCREYFAWFQELDSNPRSFLIYGPTEIIKKIITMDLYFFIVKVVNVDDQKQ